MDPIVIATGNPHKVEELRAIFAEQGIPVLGLRDLPGHERFHEPQEHGATFEENAAIKALSYAEQTGRVCLADDSGLVVGALRGAPGVISSHYASDGRETGLSRAQRDAANNERLLRELRQVPADRRGARFVCVMCLAAGSPPRVLLTSRGTFEGRIGLSPDVPRGANGFGYDPLFLLPAPDTRTSAELSPDEKNARSHRGAAAREMALKITRLWSGAAPPAPPGTPPAPGPTPPPRGASTPPPPAHRP
jgi:XTP/dITP diphosphohydrolase